MEADLWRPHAGPQTAFLSSPHYEVFYGGAAGGGKSDCLLVDALGQITHPRYRALLLRRSYPELRELIDRSRVLYPAAWPGAKFKEADRTWVFPSGARIEFGYLSADSDAYRYQGQEYTFVGFDELTHFSEWSYHFVCSRIRTTAAGLNCYVRATSNPGGVGHIWVKSRFVDPAVPGTPVVDELTGQTRVFIPSLLKDNPSLAATDYGKRLLALPDADRKALLEGDWNAYSGSVFDFIPGVHTWTWKQFEEQTGFDHIPPEWTRFRIMDWGFAKPFAIYWIAVDYEGRAYVYREFYGCEVDSKGHVRANTGLRLEPSKVAERVASLEEGEKISVGWTGPDLFSSGRGDTTAGIKISEKFEGQGIYFTPWDAGRDSRKAKKMAFHERLYVETDEEGEYSEMPGLIFLEKECPHAIRTIPALEYDPNKGGEDIDSTMEDHAYDAISAFCLMRPWRPSVKQSSPRWMRQQHTRARGLVG